MSKYLFVTPTLSIGGAERAVSVLSSSLANLGQEVCILKYHGSDSEYPVDKKVKIIAFAKDANEYKKLNRIRRVLFIRKVVKEEQPDFVIPFIFRTALAVDIATKFIKVNVFQTIRNNPAVDPPSNKDRRCRDKLIYKAKCTFAQNNAEKLYFDKRIHNKIHVLFNPVSDEFFNIQHNLKNAEFIFCGAGRLHEQKNFEMLIRSFIKAFSKNQNVKLLIYGEGHEREKLQRIIDETGCNPQVILKGRSNDMTAVFAKTDAFVLSSNYEGMPNVLIEAMASGVPCISTNCPTGPSDLIDDGQNGILVPVNDEDTLAKAMKKLYEDEQLREKFSSAGREKIKKICSSKIIAKKMMEICEANKPSTNS